MDQKKLKENKDKNNLINLFNKPVYDNEGSQIPRVIAIVGLSKNAGKTSFLNWLVQHLNNKRIAVTTTGRDGEDQDLVTGEQKPKVVLPKTCFFSTFDYVTDNSMHKIEIICKSQYRVIGKNLYIAKTIEPIETEIIGALTNKEQTEIIKAFKDLSVNIILIDGSLDRKSICLSEIITDIVLVVGAAFGTIDEIRSQCHLLSNYALFDHYPIPDYEYVTYKESTDLNVVTTDISSIYSKEYIINNIIKKNPEWIYIPGAITDVSWVKIKHNVSNYQGKFILESPVNFNIKNNELYKLVNEKTFFTRNVFNLKAIIVNSYSPNNQHLDSDFLRLEIQNIFKNLPVIDITQI